MFFVNLHVFMGSQSMKNFRKFVWLAVKLVLISLLSINLYKNVISILVLLWSNRWIYVETSI